MTAVTMLSSPTLSNKKRKDLATPLSDPLSAKKPKKDKKKSAEYGQDPSSSIASTKHHKRKNKKSKEGDQEWSEFSIVGAALVVSIPPMFASDPRAGVEEMLDSMVMRHIPSLHGVMLSHSNLAFEQSNAIIQADCPFAKCNVTFDATVWTPKIGMTLSGRVNLFAPDHISLLVHSTFNVSIPRNHIPSDEYEFEYGPAENDPEYSTGLQASGDGVTEGMSSLNIDDEDGEGRLESIGRWIVPSTGERCGGETGIVTFTVIGFTLANQMISLLGSLQHDPFNPEYNNQQHHSSLVTQSSSKPSQEDALMDDSSDQDNEDPFDTMRKKLAPGTQKRMNREAKERRTGDKPNGVAGSSKENNQAPSPKKAKKRKAKLDG